MSGVNMEDRDTAVPLETIIKRFKRLQITPKSILNGVSKSDPKDNELFTDKSTSAEKDDKGQGQYTTSDKNVVKEAENGDQNNPADKNKYTEFDGDDEGAVVKSQNGFTDDQKAKDTLKSATSTTHALATINGISLLESSDNTLKASEDLEDKKDNLRIANVASSDVFNFIATPRLATKSRSSIFRIPTGTSGSKTSIPLSGTVQQNGTSTSASIFVFGDQNTQASLTNSKSSSHIIFGSPPVKSTNSEVTTTAINLACGTSTQDFSQNKTQSTTETSATLTKAQNSDTTTSVDSSTVACFRNIEPSLLNTTAVRSEVKTCIPTFNTDQPNEASFERKTTSAKQLNAITIMPPSPQNIEIVFNKTVFMSMFDGTQNVFGKSTLQTPISIDNKSQVSSFPFRNKVAASSVLSSKKSLFTGFSLHVSQKKLHKNSSIQSTEFKMVIPTFCAAQRNFSSIYVFGGQETQALNDQIITLQNEFRIPPKTTTSTSKNNVFNKKALMSMFDGTRNLFVTSTTQSPVSNNTKSQVSSEQYETATSSESSSKKTLLSQDNLEDSCSPPTSIMSSSCTDKTNSSVYGFGNQTGAAICIPISTSQTVLPSTSKVTSSATDLLTKTTTPGSSTDISIQQDTFGASTSASLSDKSSAQEQVPRLTYTLQKNKIDLYKYKDYKAAIAMFEQAVQLCPDNVTFYGIKAHYYMKLGMYREAVKDIQKVITSDSSFTDGYICLAMCYIALGYTSAADEAISKVVVARGDAQAARALAALREMRARHEHAQRAFAARDFARARAAADRFVALCPSNYAFATKAKCLVMLGEIEEASMLADQCLRNDDSEPEALYAKGLSYHYLDNLDLAVDYFERVLALSPLHLGAIDSLQKANKLIRLAEEEAEANNRCDYEKVVTINNEALTIGQLDSRLFTFRLYFNNAVAYSKLNKTQSTVEACTAALEIMPFDVKLVKMRAKCYFQLGQYEDAVRDCESVAWKRDGEIGKLLKKAKALVQEKEKVYREKMTSVESLIHDSKFQEAQKLADEGLQLSDALYFKGLCSCYMGQYERALEYLQEVLNIEPNHDRALRKFKETTTLKATIEQGDALFSSGEWLKAGHKYREAKKIDPENLNLTVKMGCNIAETYLKENRINNAIEEYTDVLMTSRRRKFNSAVVDVLHKRAECYAEVESYLCAIHDFEEIHKLAECAETRQRALDSINTLKEKFAYREKIKSAENVLIASRETKNIEVALKLAEECLLRDSSDKRAFCVKGLCLYYMGQYEQALGQFQHVLHLEPSHSKALKETKKISYLKRTIEEGDLSLSEGRWQHALDKFEEALTIDERNKNLNVGLHCKKAATIIKLVNSPDAVLTDPRPATIRAAIEEYTKALKLDTDCVEALRGRMTCYVEIESYEEAIEDHKRLRNIDPSADDLFIRKYAEQQAAAGDELYKRKKYRDALEMYKEAIEQQPETAEYYGKTFSCYMNLSMLEEALVDAKKAVALDAKCSEGCDSIVQCYLALGELSGAERAIARAGEAGREWSAGRRALEALQRPHAQAQRHIEEQDYERAVACMDRCLESAPFSSRMKLIKAECLVKLGKIEQALEIADDCIRADKSDSDALFVKGLCKYYNEKHDEAVKYFKEVLRLSPDHVKAIAAYKKANMLKQKKDQGNQEFKMGRWQEALLLYDEALTVDATHTRVNAKLHYNKATTYWKLNRTQAAAEACSAALALHENYAKALLLRAKCFSQLEEYDCVVDDYEQLCRIDPTPELHQLLDEAKRSRDLRSRNKNYYNILGVNINATAPIITKAYKQLSLVHHPDRHSGACSFTRRRHQRRFQELLEAYTVLSDPVQRAVYDLAEMKRRKC